MRLTAVAMIRNEADILPDFLGHCAALFDDVLVVDHASTDGTAEILAAAATRMPLTVLRFAQHAYVQSLIVTALVREAFARGASWVFPLDADELPMVAGRAALIGCLPEDATMVQWRWRNLWPQRPAGFADFSAEGEHEVLPPASTGVVKVAVSRRLHDRVPRFTIAQGSHGLSRGREDAGTPIAIGHLAHFPIRSRERFVLKAELGARAVSAIPSVSPRSGFQWRQAAESGERFDGAAGLQRLRSHALRYPHVAQTDVVDTITFTPLGRMNGLPAGVPDAEAVRSREAEVTWHPLPDGPKSEWRIICTGDALVLKGRSGRA
ncbi:glycosyltransferase family 2 protein [Roseomonas fluvialis]|uniref:Glycosyl transferase family 2 n=1 Tax=Roseomonas fluvialis TaxID=1750527 RepID=A0ABM7Y771_9PROT|nr:glycosyltransferase family 2 protein [Roseomonas fluvialis]BDG73816.1 hypothetical protein Rmf_37450 [Roseomonas fluvialis]